MWESTSNLDIKSFEKLCNRLSKNDPKVVEVNCARFTMGDLLVDTLVDSIQCNTVAKTLIIPLQFLTPDSAAIIGARTSISEIRLVRGENPEIVQVLEAFFKHASKSLALKRVAIQGSRINRDIAVALQDFLLQSQSIEELNLSRTGLNNELFRLIVPAIHESMSLERLDLSFNDFNHESVTRLFEKLDLKLSFLDISYNVIDSSGIRSLSGYLLESESEFFLKIGPISSFGMMVFLDHLPRMKSLKNLEIVDASGLNDEVWSTLRHALGSNSFLDALTLCESEDANGRVSSAIGDALLQNKTLRRLDMMYSDVTEVGAAHLSEALEVNQTLKALNLRYNLLQDEGAAVFGQRLGHMTGLEELVLSENQIGVDGLKALLDGLHQNRSLRCFNIEANPGLNQHFLAGFRFRTRLNILATTAIILDDQTPLALWSRLIESLAERKWIDVLNYLLRQKPVLVKY